jgi:hypothetical protein
MFDKKNLFSWDYGKEIGQVPQSKISEEENNGEESGRAQERREPHKRA